MPSETLKDYLIKFKKSLDKSIHEIKINIINAPIKNPIKTIGIFVILTIVIIDFFRKWEWFIYISNIFLNLLQYFYTNQTIYSSDGAKSITHELNWVAITAIVAGLTYVSNSLYNTKKYKADLISKSRIEWMQNQRASVSKYVGLCDNYLDKCITLTLIGRKIPTLRGTRSEVLKNLDDLRKEIDISYCSLKISFSDSEGNKKIVEHIEELHKELDQALQAAARESEAKNESELDSELVERAKKVYDALSSLNKLVTIARDYFKDEWEKAKKGK